MTNIRISFIGENPGLLFARSAGKQAERVRKAMRAAAQDVVDETLARGREDIQASGNFGSSRWLDGLKMNKTEGGGVIKLQLSHDVSYFMAHQTGATIRGKPLLYIPFDFADDAKEVNARNYPGRLFKVVRKKDSLPLLFSIGPPAVPKYFGKTEVTLKKRFHVLEIARQVARRLGEYYSQRFRSDTG